MEQIWLHGHACDCPQCESGRDKAKHMVFDRGGEDFSDFEFPAQIGDRGLLIDQHGNVYDLRYVGWMKPTD